MYGLLPACIGICEVFLPANISFSSCYVYDLLPACLVLVAAVYKVLYQHVII